MFYTQGVKKDECNPEHEDDRGRSRTEILYEIYFSSSTKFLLCFAQ